MAWKTCARSSRMPGARLVDSTTVRAFLAARRDVTWSSTRCARVDAAGTCFLYNLQSRSRFALVTASTSAEIRDQRCDRGTAPTLAVLDSVNVSRARRNVHRPQTRWKCSNVRVWAWKPYACCAIASSSAKSSSDWNSSNITSFGSRKFSVKPAARSTASTTTPRPTSKSLTSRRIEN